MAKQQTGSDSDSSWAWAGVVGVLAVAAFVLYPCIEEGCQVAGNMADAKAMRLLPKGDPQGLRGLIRMYEYRFISESRVERRTRLFQKFINGPLDGTDRARTLKWLQANSEKLAFDKATGRCAVKERP